MTMPLLAGVMQGAQQVVQDVETELVPIPDLAIDALQPWNKLLGAPPLLKLLVEHRHEDDRPPLEPLDVEARLREAARPERSAPRRAGPRAGGALAAKRPERAHEPRSRGHQASPVGCVLRSAERLRSSDCLSTWRYWWRTSRCRMPLFERVAGARGRRAGARPPSAHIRSRGRTSRRRSRLEGP